MQIGFQVLIAALAVTVCCFQARATPLSDAQVTEYSRIVFFGPVARRDEALNALLARNNPDVAPALILAVRYRGLDKKIMQTLQTLTGRPFADWKAAMVWQETQTDLSPHPSFRDIKRQILNDIDPAFDRFFGKRHGPHATFSIRMEEIVWGGAWVDSIPSLDAPAMVSGEAANYLRDDDLVFGIAINGDYRAYPLRILGWHEMLNDVVGGVPVVLAYCPLCGSGILYETTIEASQTPLQFGSSGLLYRSNKLMFDRQTGSLWHHLTGKPVSGALLNRDITLKQRPMTIARWSDWKIRHPATKVLDLQTGYNRNYEPGFVYRDYAESPDLLYPANVGIGVGVESERHDLSSKTHVFGLQTFGKAKAWPIEAFRNAPVINDRLGDRTIVLIGDPEGRSVRAYDREGLTFEPTQDPAQFEAASDRWTLTEDYLLGPQGKRLPRLPGRITYWFAWNNHLAFESEVYRLQNE